MNVLPILSCCACFASSESWLCTRLQELTLPLRPATCWPNVFANSLFNTGVTCFILLSGYFGIRFDLKKLIGLDLMVIFFTVLGTVALGDFGSKDLIKSCIPVLSRRYWFITCYFVLCILAPFLNQVAERLEREHFRRLLLLLLLVFSLIPTLTTYDVMQDAGKGLAHFVMIYLLGRYLACLSHRTLFQKAAAPRNCRIHGAHLLRRRSADPASGYHLQHFFTGLFDLYYFYRCSAAVALP